MKNKTILLIIAVMMVLLCSAASTYKNHQVKEFSDDDPLNFLLTTDDLLQVCDWHQVKLITRPVAFGMYTFTEFQCGKDPAIRKVFQVVLVTNRIFNPGDGKVLFSGGDIGNDDSLLDLGSWGTKYHTLYDGEALIFTKQNIIEYIGACGYSEHFTDGYFDDVYALGIVSADRIPDHKVSPYIKSIITNQFVDENFVSIISKTKPKTWFYNTDAENPVMQVYNNDILGPVSLTALFYEPQQITVEIYTKDTHDFRARMILPPVLQANYELNNEINPSFSFYNDDFYNKYFFSAGTYTLEASIDGKMIYIVDFTIKR